MFENQPVLVERIEPFLSLEEALPAAGSNEPHFPQSNVLVLEHNETATKDEPSSTEIVWPLGEYDVHEGALIIGGVKLNRIEAGRASSQSTHSRGLAIPGTVSNESYVAKVESRRVTKVKRALVRMLRFVGVLPESHSPNRELDDAAL